MKHKPLSLKWELIAIVLVCFVLPIFVYAASTVFMIFENVERQSAQTVTYNFNYAVRGAQNNLQDVINASRDASINPTVRNAYSQYAKDGDKVGLYDSVQGFLARNYQYESNIPATMLFFMEEPQKIYSITNGPRSSFNEITNQYNKYVHPIMLDLSDEIGTDVRFVEYEGSVYMARNIMDSNYRPYAMIVMLLDPSEIFSALTGMAWQQGCTVVLDDIVIPLSGNGASVPPGASVTTATAYTREGGVYSLYTQRKLETHGITYAAEVGNLPLSDQVPSFYYTMLFAVVLTGVLMTVFIVFFYRNITKPVVSLTAAAKVVQKGELGYQMDTGFRSEEFTTLANSFNSMSAQLEEMFEQNNREQLALQDARIDALQSQINPHFLNNTLEIINWEARMAGAANVSAMIEALSTMLSGAMARDGNAMVRISDEMVYLDSYLHIISARLGKRLDVKKEVDAELLSQKVPRLILQPLVENAVEHGVIPRQHGQIILRVYREGDDVVLEVENDAPLSPKDDAAIRRLLDEEAKQPATGQERLGIRNVHERLQLIYGKRGGLTVTSEGETTVARIWIKGGRFGVYRSPGARLFPIQKHG